jgi:hypothetical protein
MSKRASGRSPGSDAFVLRLWDSTAFAELGMFCHILGIEGRPWRKKPL